MVRYCQNQIFLLNFFIVVSCYEWYSYIETDNCVDLSILNNGWASSGDLETLTNNEKKTLLMEKLSFYLNGKIHTELELSNREVSSKLGSLCGMSAIYQAAVDTFFTVFQLKNMTFEEIKQEFYIHMSLDPVADKFKTDQDLLETFHNCK